MQMIIWFSYTQVDFGNRHQLSTILNCDHIINILTTSTHAVRLLIIVLNYFVGNMFAIDNRLYPIILDNPNILALIQGDC